MHHYLQGKRQANEVHHHLFIGKFYTEKTQQSEEGLVVLLAAALLLTAQVDVSVELLSVLREGCTRRTSQTAGVGALEFKCSSYMNVNIHISKATFFMNKLSCREHLSTLSFSTEMSEMMLQGQKTRGS